MQENERMAAGPPITATWTRRDLAAALRVSTRTIDRLVAAGQFPPPFHVGHSCRWLDKDIAAFTSRPAGHHARKEE